METTCFCVTSLDFRSASRENCCRFSTAESIVLSGPVGTYDNIFVLSKILGVSKWGLLVDERRGLTATG
jgi:hypothetical protein